MSFKPGPNHLSVQLTHGHRGAPSRTSLRTLLPIPTAGALALVVHWAAAGSESPGESLVYTRFLCFFLGAAIVAAGIQPFWASLRWWLHDTGPIVAAFILFLSCWETITAGLNWLPLPYFPSPAGVLLSLVTDRAMICDSAWHSLLLLAQGYALGVATGLVTGICIGWFAFAKYWGMPILKIVGPIPATAWIPLAMVISPSTRLSAVALIAIAVWFPVTMLTASGVSNTRASYLDVARALGANRAYLILRVALPAAMPSIFTGLFMGLGASFLTLVVAETVGVKSGLGWYLTWAQGWAEYGKVYAGLTVLAVCFSAIITILFKFRDRALAWQKGTIKW